jgi:hypothetical protein
LSYHQSKSDAVKYVDVGGVPFGNGACPQGETMIKKERI